MKRIHSIRTNVRKCLDPCLILIHFNPSFIHLLSLLFFGCTSLHSYSPCHSFPHFLTPSWLLWPLNVSRWEDTTPIVIHPALSDHCVPALVNTAPLPSLAVVPLNDWGGGGQSIEKNKLRAVAWLLVWWYGNIWSNACCSRIRLVLFYPIVIINKSHKKKKKKSEIFPVEQLGLFLYGYQYQKCLQNSLKCWIGYRQIHESMHWSDTM